MVRLLKSLLLVCMFFAGPALCFGGLVKHACECTQSGTEQECQHEDSCSDDPCTTLVVQQDRDVRDLLDVEWFLVTPLRVPFDLEPDSKRCFWALIPPMPPDRSNLPYPQSDRPLLV